MPVGTVPYSSPAGRRASRLFWPTVGLALLAAGVTVGAEVHAGDGPPVNGVTLWSVAPFAALIAVAVWVRRDPSGSAVVLVATALAAGAGGWELHDFLTSTHSTAALGLVAMPAVQLAAAVVAAVVALALKAARRVTKGRPADAPNGIRHPGATLRPVRGSDEPA